MLPDEIETRLNLRHPENIPHVLQQSLYVSDGIYRMLVTSSYVYVYA